MWNNNRSPEVLAEEKERIISLWTKPTDAHLQEDLVKPFEVHDPFNGNQLVQGWICQQSDYRYGSLIITAVRGEATAPELIYCTPKYPYPFVTGDTSNYSHLRYSDEEIKEYRFYDKLDGTNICAYSYADADGKRYQTYKTRRTPIIQATRADQYTRFDVWWEEMLQRYPRIRSIPSVMSGECAAIFELYGRRNGGNGFDMLVTQDCELDTRLISGVRQADHNLLIPEYFIGEVEPEVRLSATVVQTKATMESRGLSMSKAQLISDYEFMVNEAEMLNQEFQEDRRIIKSEGFMVYVRCMDDKSTHKTLYGNTTYGEHYVVYKLKPPSVTELAWASDQINPIDVRMTVRNSLEDLQPEDLNFEYVKELLLEEYSEMRISKSEVAIRKEIALVQEQVQFEAIARALYDQHVVGQDDYENWDKGQLMRSLVPHLENKREAGRLFQALIRMGYVTDTKRYIKPSQKEIKRYKP